MALYRIMAKAEWAFTALVEADDLDQRRDRKSVV